MRWKLKLADGSIESVELLSMSGGIYEFQVGERKVTLSYPLSFPFNLTTMEVALSIESWTEHQWRAVLGNQVILVEPVRNEGSQSSSGDQIRTQMPGRILRVLVKPGDFVRAQQTLLVMEAMKMENEIRASKDAKVAAVHVTAGASVEAGMVLVELAPAD